MQRLRPTIGAIFRSPWVRLVGTVLGIGIVLHSINVGDALHGLMTANVRWVTVGVLLTGVTVLASVAEWGFLIRAGGTRLRWRSLASWYIQGLFVGQVLPAAIGGDAMRAVELGKVTGPGHALASLAGSRMAGALGMAGWGLAGAVLLRSSVGAVGLVGAGAFLVGIVLAWLAALNANGAVAWLSQGASGLRRTMIRGLMPFTGAFKMYRSQPHALVKSVVVGSAGWGINLAALAVFARAVGIDEGWTIFAVAIPISLVATLSPFSINGIGVREGLLVGLLSHAGVALAKAAAFAIFVDIQMIPFALLGGVVWLLRSRAVSARPVPSP